MQKIMIRKTQSLVDRRKENSVDKNNRRESLIQSKEIDEEEHAVFSYHIKTLNDLIYWVDKDVAAIESMLIEIRKKNVEINNFYNVIISERTRYEVEYERLKKRVEEFEQKRNNDENENVESLDVSVESVRNASVKIDASVSTIINTSKKLFDSSIFIDDMNSNIEDWLSTMRNKLKENADWFSIETSKKAYVRTRIDEDAMKHLTSRFEKDSIKSFMIVEKIFDDLNRIFDDFNKRINALKAYKRLKQIETNKKFHTFWAEFQRLVSDSKMYDEIIFLKDFKNKMFWDLQRTLTSDIYKAIDLYEFARLCQFIDQTLRDVNSKARNINRDEYEESESTSRNNLNNQESSNQESSNQESSRDQSNTFRFRSQTSASFRASTQASIEEQVNAFNCYNCEKSEHLTRNCEVSKKLNSNNFVRKIEKNVLNDDDQNESKKE